VEQVVTGLKKIPADWISLEQVVRDWNRLEEFGLGLKQLDQVGKVEIGWKPKTSDVLGFGLLRRGNFHW